MAKCMVCNKIAILSTTFGNVLLCKNCASLVSASTWKDRNFSSMNEVRDNKDNATQLAKNNGFPQEIINSIASYFDEYINAGFVTTINGKAGQRLKIFNDYCTIYTKSESVKNSLIEIFYQMDDTYVDDSVLTTSDKRNLVNGLLSGSVIGTGIKAAVSVGMNQMEKEKNEERKLDERNKAAARLISVGEKRINFGNIVRVDVHSNANTSNGCIIFVPKGVSQNDIYRCEYFIFNKSIPFESKKIKKQIDSVIPFISERIGIVERYGVNIQNATFVNSTGAAMQNPNTMLMSPTGTVMQNTNTAFMSPTGMVTQTQNITPKQTDQFDEIRKYKQLLDEGIISDDEFNAKKKELLGL